MNATTYQYFKSLGVCPSHPGTPALPGYVCCAVCLDAFTLPETRAHMRLVRAAVGARRPMPPDAGQPTHGQYLACCGQWHEITGIPFLTPCCGQTYFAELELTHDLPGSS